MERRKTHRRKLCTDTSRSAQSELVPHYLNCKHSDSEKCTISPEAAFFRYSLPITKTQYAR